MKANDKEPDFGTRMFCDRFIKDPPPPNKEVLEFTFNNVMDKMIEIMGLANELKQKGYNNKFNDGGVVNPIYKDPFIK